MSDLTLVEALMWNGTDFIAGGKGHEDKGFRFFLLSSGYWDIMNIRTQVKNDKW